MRRTTCSLVAMVLAVACRGPAPDTEEHSAPKNPAAAAPVPEGSEAEAEVPERESDPMLDTGIILRSHEGRDWGVHLLLPVRFGFTSVDLDELFSFEQVASVSVVPTAEFIVPINERWTLLPFIGLGAAYQTGAEELIGGNNWLGLATGGVRATRWQHFAQRHWFGFSGQVRYDAALGVPDGLLGDWGSLEGAVEVRRDFGAPREGARFEGGLFFQGTWFFDPVQLDAEGISPEVVVNNLEVGVSLGSSSPYKIIGITLPRIFLGYFFGEEIRGVRIRFGRL